MDTKRVTIKITLDAKEKLDAIAVKQRRNLVNTLEYALDVYLALHNEDGSTKYSLDSIVDQRTSNNAFDLIGNDMDNAINSDDVNNHDDNNNKTNITESTRVQQQQEYSPLF